MSSALPKKLTSILDNAIAQNTFPGAVAGVVDRRGKRAYAVAGAHTYDSNSPRVTKDTCYDVASITKVVPTSSLALQLVDQGVLSLSTPVAKIVPEFIDPTTGTKNRVTLEHLVGATLGYQTKLATLATQGAPAILQAVLEPTFCFAPGARHESNNSTSILLGLVLERTTNTPLDQLAHERFFTPLHMRHTGFTPSPRDGQPPPTEIQDGTVVQGIVHDESARALRPKVVGSAGLFTTTDDLLTFAHMMLQRGEVNHKRYFSQKMVDRITTTGIGWQHRVTSQVGQHASSRTISKSGFTGSLLAIDANAGLAWTLLSNRTYPTRPTNNDAINQVRCEVADALLS